MRARLRRVVALTLACGLLATAACSDGGTDGKAEAKAPPTTEPVPERDAEIDPVLTAFGEMLDDEGVLPLDTALGIVSAEVVPLPGIAPVALPEGPAPDDLAGVALRRVVGARAELDPAAVEVVDGYLAGSPDDEVVEIPVGSGRNRIIELPDGPGDDFTPEELTFLIESIVGQMEDHSGHDLQVAVTVRRITGRTASAVGTGGTLERPAGCRLSIPTGIGGDGGASFVSTVAHEIWHCFQLDSNPVAFETAPAWVIEGQAEWAGETVAGGSASSASRWDTWLLTPQSALPRRSYDAIGLYAVADQQGADPWRTMLPMIGRSTTDAVGTLFGSAAPEALVAVAERLVRAPDVGAQWESDGPGITAGQAAQVLALDGDAPARVEGSAGRLATFPVVLAVPAEGDIVSIRIEGGTAAAVQLPGTGIALVGPGASARFCLDPEGCVCPDGTSPYGELPAAEPGEGAAAIAAMDPGAVAVSGELQSMEEACEDRLVGVWQSDVATYLEQLGQSLGGACTGPYTVTFSPEGVFTAHFEAVCTGGRGRGEGEGTFQGTYVDDGSNFTLVGVDGGGTMVITIDGRSQTVSLPGLGEASGSAPIPYTVTGDTLTYTYGSTVTFTRAG